MSNSVVKVTDSMLNDSLLLLVGEDGTVTPDKETVETFLNAQTGVTNIQLMHINKSDGQSIDVAVENVMYTPDADEVQILENTQKMDRMAKILYNIRLDHDYTQLTEPPVEEDELAKTLSILDGDGDIPPLITTTTSIIQQQPPSPEKTHKELNISTTKPAKVTANKSASATVAATTTTKTNNKRIKTRSKSTTISKYEQDDDYKDEEFSDENDSDFELESKVAKRPKLTKLEIKENKIKSPKAVQITKPKVENVKVEKLPPLPVQIVQSPTTTTTTTTPEAKSPDKKPAKKEKKPVKPIPDDFALFSTPDIIRRVGGGKEPTGLNETSPSSSEMKLPAKIENRSRSASESSQSSQKQSRLSLDGKVSSTTKTSEHNKRLSVDSKSKRNSVDSVKKSDVSPTTSFAMNNMSENREASIQNEISSFDESKSFSLDTTDLTNSDHNNMALDGTGLDLDPSLLDNINNDLISDDILYQVAQSLVSNPELQNAIDKSLDEAGNLLDTSMPDVLSSSAHIQSGTTTLVQTIDESDGSSSSINQKGTQIVRPDGRIVVIPPIERPTTRSRNKKKDTEKGPPPAPKFTHKPLDEEHVSGNELDSSGEDEEESEDDPNKLWCICNQPHNNRFMICCDTCEEWYHGKCVNITKAMGQQMESEGKEWICLFCKDPDLKRPQAAARRIRKASRNSRQSTESGSSSTTKLNEKVAPSGGTVPCVVCQKASRINSIFCSETCILAHAQGVERVVVFERATGNMLTGNKAPSASNLEQWLRDHPGYEVVRSAGKVVTTKPSSNNMTQSRLKIVKNSDNEGVSLAISKKSGVNIGVLKHLPKAKTTLSNNSKLMLTSKSKPPGFNKPKQTATVAAAAASTATNQKPKTLTQTPPSKSQSSSSSPITTSVLKAKITQTLTKAQATASSSTTPSPKEKPSVPAKTPKARQAETPLTPQPKQENIRENVQKTVFEQLTNRLKLVEDLKLTEDELKNISTEIESQLYKCFGDTGQKYRNKYRSLIFNIKDVKNQTLWRRICEKSINPYQLVRLSPDDMASQELALWREREAKHQLDMIKKSELELLNCNRQYVLKTHKGEQVLEDNRPTDTIDTTEVITSLTDGEKAAEAAAKKDVSDKKSSSKHGHKEKERKGGSDRSVSKDHHNHRSSSKEHADRNRKRSRSRDRKHNDSRRRSRSRGRDRHRKSSHKSSRHKKDSHRGSSTDKLDKKSKEILEQLVDNKIVPPLEDGLWKQGDVVLPTPPVAESDSDHEPSSTVTIPTPPRSSEFDEIQDVKQQQTSSTKSSTIKEEKLETEEEEEESTSSSPVPATKPKSEEIWRGIINMIDVAQISITAHEVSGDCNGLGTDLPPSLDIVGRISPDTVWDYIGKMRCSNSKIISLVRLNAINEEEKMPYLALYSYLSSRNRLGVVKSTNKAVKDFYIWPLAAHKPIPQALLPISGPGFEEARPALLLGIIVRDKRKRVGGESTLSSKKPKLEVPSPPPRSYTPPPAKDIRSKLPLPPAVVDPDDDEPYSPEDSDPEGAPPTLVASTSFLDVAAGAASSSGQPFQPFSSKFDDIIPGLETPTLPSTTQEIQRQMEKLNKEIEMQKSEIDSISQNIATASTEIGTSALASIALPSNLQQILDSIKTIGAVADVNSSSGSAQEAMSTDLTIPLMLPTSFSRGNSAADSDTIPLNIPNKNKKQEEKPTTSVLSSLSEEDLIRKAEEMLGQSESSDNLRKSSSSNSGSNSSQYVYIPGSKTIVEMPPIPGLEDEPFES